MQNSLPGLPTENVASTGLGFVPLGLRYLMSTMESTSMLQSWLVYVGSIPIYACNRASYHADSTPTDSGHRGLVSSCSRD